MKNLKILGFLATVAMGLIALPAIVSATTVTSPTGTSYTGELKGETVGHAVLELPIAKLECSVAIEGLIESHGSGTTAKGTGTGFTIGPCTNSWHKTTITSGIVEAHWTSGYNGTITSSGATIVSTRLGVTCTFATNSTDIGTVTGGSPATLHLAAQIPIHSGSSALCGTGTLKLSGTGKATSPATVYLDQ